jgi:hypothetical protein
MENYIKSITLHQSIVDSIYDKTSWNVHQMVKTLLRYTSNTFQDILTNANQYNNDLDVEMFKYYNIYLNYHYGQDSLTICDNVHEKLLDKNKMFQGGFGHWVYSKYWKFPCHWCIKPEYYNEIKLNEYEELALKIHHIDLIIKPNASQEIWGN